MSPQETPPHICRGLELSQAARGLVCDGAGPPATGVSTGPAPPPPLTARTVPKAQWRFEAHLSLWPWGQLHSRASKGHATSVPEWTPRRWTWSWIFAQRGGDGAHGPMQTSGGLRCEDGGLSPALLRPSSALSPRTLGLLPHPRLHTVARASPAGPWLCLLPSHGKSHLMACP